jgi:ATP-dependent DNA ligase
MAGQETIERLKSFCLLMPKKPLPKFVAPMQASSVKKPFDSPDWIFETKLDGYRAIAVIDSAGIPIASKMAEASNCSGRLCPL